MVLRLGCTFVVAGSDVQAAWAALDSAVWRRLQAPALDREAASGLEHWPGLLTACCLRPGPGLAAVRWAAAESGHTWLVRRMASARDMRFGFESATNAIANEPIVTSHAAVT